MTPSDWGRWSLYHHADADCDGYLAHDDTCNGCGVSHSHPCRHCGGRGYHAAPCFSDTPTAVRAIIMRRGYCPLTESERGGMAYWVAREASDAGHDHGTAWLAAHDVFKADAAEYRRRFYGASRA